MLTCLWVVDIQPSKRAPVCYALLMQQRVPGVVGLFKELLPFIGSRRSRVLLGLFKPLAYVTAISAAVCAYGSALEVRQSAYFPLVRLPAWRARAATRGRHKHKHMVYAGLPMLPR